MWSRCLAGLRFEVEHRARREGGGPTLRVRDPARDGRELLRFDCFARQPHFHVDPEGRDEVTPLDPLADTVAWTVETLRADLPAYLEKAGHEATAGAGGAALDALLRAAEGAMRNPPVALDDLDPAVLHARLGEKWKVHPPDVLPAWVAEMDFPLAEPVRQVLQRATDRSDVGYPIAPLRTGLPEAFAARMRDRFGWDADPAQVEILTDVVQGLYLGLLAYAAPEDGAVVQTPIYPPFLSAVRETGRRLVECRMEPGEGGWHFDLEALRAADDRTRILMLCNPHNPTGRVLRREELEGLAALVVERDWVVLADEIHGDLVYAPGTHVPFATLSPEVAARTVTLTSATKAFNIPGLRCAVAHFGSAALRRRFDAAVPHHVRGGIGLLGLYATQAAWRHGQPWLDAVMERLDANRATVAAFVRERLPRVVHHPPEATYLAWLDLRALDLPTTPGRFLLERGRVALSDGRHFGPGFEGFARLNFATSPALLDQVLERVASALATR